MTDHSDYSSDVPKLAPTNLKPILSELTLNAIQTEATRAYLRWGEQSILGAAITEDARLAILTEEVGEVARELNEDRLGICEPGEWKAKRVKELIQVAAMAATWIEHLEGKRGNND
jgi:hypothetical protein